MRAAGALLLQFGLEVLHAFAHAVARILLQLFEHAGGS
jgi:hypothetical protein